jgi:TfoX/Sxy family transcriptional regulator of competence genes
MAFDEGLADRIRERLADVPGVTDKRMFGGISFLIEGNMTVAIRGDDLMVRVGVDAVESALLRPGAQLVRMGDRLMRGWVVVDGSVLDDDVLAEWIEQGRAFVATLPPK